jgi:hypothetical protein
MGAYCGSQVLHSSPLLIPSDSTKVDRYLCAKLPLSPSKMTCHVKPAKTRPNLDARGQEEKISLPPAFRCGVEVITTSAPSLLTECDTYRHPPVERPIARLTVGSAHTPCFPVETDQSGADMPDGNKGPRVCSHDQNHSDNSKLYWLILV